MRQNDKKSLAALALVLAAATASAQESGDRETIQLAQAGDDAAVAQYDQLLKDTEGLQVYNALVQRQIDAQMAEIESFRSAMELVPELERQVPPLIIRMVDGLDKFVKADIPFLADERAQRVADLQLLVERSDVTDAEKLRRVLEAWQIETEYGSSFNAYRGELDIDGVTRQVDFLQLGRVGLLYQTIDDEELTGAWDMQNGGWTDLGSDYRNAVRQALRMAENQVAPDLVLLPIPSPE